MQAIQKASRFDYVAYDAEAAKQQAAFKEKATEFENMIKYFLKSPRWTDACLMKLEEAYMCVGKAIRDDQITRNGSAPLQESRGNE